MTNGTTLESRTDNSRASVNGADRIVFYDGVCGLCNHTVNCLMHLDRNAILRFAPLQGNTAGTIVPEEVRKNLSTFVYAREGQLYCRSTAMLRILRDLGGAPGILATLLWIIPAPLRDVVYRLVASIRYRTFGRHDTCRMPTPEERSRFLD